MFFLRIMVTRTFSFQCGNKEQEMMHITTHLSVASVSPRGETWRSVFLPLFAIAPYGLVNQNWVSPKPSLFPAVASDRAQQQGG